MKRIYTGTTVKTCIRPKGTGFDIDNHEWSVEVRYGGNKTYKTFERADMRVRHNDQFNRNDYYIVVDTTKVTGVVKAIVRAKIPDNECDGGIRNEVAVIELYTVDVP